MTLLEICKWIRVTPLSVWIRESALMMLVSGYLLFTAGAKCYVNDRYKFTIGVLVPAVLFQLHSVPLDDTPGRRPAFQAAWLGGGGAIAGVVAWCRHRRAGYRVRLRQVIKGGTPMLLRQYFPISVGVFVLVSLTARYFAVPVLPFVVVLLAGETLLGFELEDHKVGRLVGGLLRSLKSHPRAN
jgi:hypothetical protein